ncbi:MAG: TlpA family protein disulfide reductase [Gemmatimonadaceae bacterium]|nr:TlpA family protein disulfide reductase [Gemmatimonadaceae bacterium]
MSTTGAPVPSRSRWRRWLTLPNLFTAGVLLWAAPRCWPHVEALAGMRHRTRERVAQFTVTTRDGRTLNAESLRGRVVLINVWATWCPPCRAEMPALRQLADAYAADSVVVLGFSVDRGPAAAVDAFLRDRHITYPVAIVSDGVIAALGGVQGYPTSFLLDRQGVIRHTVIGPVGPLTLRPAIRRLVAESKGSRPSS